MKNIKERFGSKLKKRNGFTLIEMLIVVAILAILVVVSIPLVTTSINDAKQAADDANLRSAKAVAVIEYVGNDKTSLETTPMYYDAKNGKLVPSATAKDLEGYRKVTDTDPIIRVSVTPATGTDGPIIIAEWAAKPTA